LQGLDVTLESLLLQLMVCFECEDLVVSFLGETLAGVGARVEFLGIITHQVDVTDDVLVGTKLVAVLLSHHVDVSTEATVLSLNVIVADQGLIELVLQQSDFVLILLHFGGFWAHCLEVLSFLCELNKDLLVLVFQDHKTPIYSG
jgi:hypothetical protein